MRKILWLVFLFASLNVYSQTYSFLRLDNTNGLSNNQVGCIYRDSRGFMWFGTNYGLNRYDGYEFKVYKSVKNDTTSIPYNAVNEIQEDVNGNLWIRGNPNYLIYDVHTERFIRNISPVLLNLGVKFSPSLVAIDHQKNYYFYQFNEAVYKYDIHQKKLITFKQGSGLNSLNKGTIINIKPVGDAFWVLYQSGLLERYNERTQSVDFRNIFVQEKSVGASVEKNLYIDTDGNPWVYPGIGDKGTLFYDLKAGNWRYFGNDKKDFRTPGDRFITSDLVRDIAQDQQGRIWIATDHGGVNIYDKNTATSRT